MQRHYTVLTEEFKDMNKEEIQRTSLYVPLILWKKIRNLAIDRRKSANDLVVYALEREYGEVKK
jgi:hypothetical protein